VIEELQYCFKIAKY